MFRVVANWLSATKMFRSNLLAAVRLSILGTYFSLTVTFSRWSLPDDLSGDASVCPAGQMFA